MISKSDADYIIKEAKRCKMMARRFGQKTSVEAVLIKDLEDILAVIIRSELGELCDYLLWRGREIE